MKITLTTVCLLSASALLGCSGSGFEDGGDGDGSDVGGDKDRSGEFHMLHLPSADGCGLVSSENVRMELTKVKVAADGKSFTFQAGSDATAKCTDTGDQFECEPIVDVLSDEEGAKVELTLTYAATWDGDDKITAAYEAKLACTGDQCADANADFGGRLPCDSSGVLLGYRAMPENFAPEIGAYKATVTQTFTTCQDFSAPQSQALTVQSSDDRNAQVTSDDGQNVPHECVFEGKGKTTCTRTLSQVRGTRSDNLTSTSIADLAWTSATSFEGGAFQMVDCAEGKDCSSFGQLPCVAFYLIEATATATK